MADTARIEELRRRVQMDPASIAFAALAEEYRRARRFDDAIAACRTGLQRHPAYLSARVTLGRSLLEIGQYDEARRELEQVLRVAPENLAAIRALADIHHRVGELPESDHQFDSAEPQAVPDAPAALAPQVPQATVPAAPQIAAVLPLIAAVPLQAAAPAPAQVVAAIVPQVAAPTVPQTPAPVITSNPAPAARPPAPAARQPHPDEVALPALEAFLSAIVVARTSGNHVSH